jgi:hypothetical protein
MIGSLLRTILMAGCLVSVCAPALAQDANDQEVSSPFPETAPPHQVLLHPHRGQRDRYLWSTFGPPGILDSALSAGFEQWTNRPEEWGQTRRGYFKRLASEYSESAINESTKYMLARLRDEDPSFRPCDCSGFRRRALHAIVSPFIAYSFVDGKPQFSTARIVGTVTSHAISASVWKPTPTTVATESAHLGTDLVSKIAVDLLREFLLHRKRDLSVASDAR